MDRAGAFFRYTPSLRGLLLPLLILAAAPGCRYAAPLSTPQGRHIDAAVTGKWRQESDATGKAPGPERTALILEFTATKYLIRYRVGGKVLYFRGYPLRVHGRRLVQLQLIGTRDGPVNERDRKYDIAAYSVTGDEMTVSLLNGDLVGTGLDTRAKLAKAFGDHAGDQDLFKLFGRFGRVKTVSSK